MQQRRSSALGRPSGTDGSDFSYRMVVDSCYTKVAKGKSHLSKLIFIQAVIQLIGLSFTFLLTSKEEGRKHSRVSFLRVCMVVSSIAILLSIFCIIKSKLILQVINNLTGWEAKKFELLETAFVLLGSLVHIFLISTIISPIGNMSPPKKLHSSFM